MTYEELVQELADVEAQRTMLLQQVSTEYASISGILAEITRLSNEAHERTDKLTELSESISALRQRAEELQAEIAAWVPPDTDPIQPKPSDILVVFDPASMLSLDMWIGAGSRYSRFQQHESWVEGTTVKVPFCRQSIPAGGKLLPFTASTYHLLLDGSRIASFVPAAGATKGVFDVVVDGLPHGYHLLQVEDVEGETGVPWPVYINAGGPLPQWMPVGTSSHEYAIGNADFRIMWVPAKQDPTILPLEKRTFTPFDDARRRQELSLELLIPGSQRRPAIAKGGEMTTMQRQWYTIGDAVTKVPKQPLLDGPRGKSCLGFITHAEVGTGTQTVDPTSAPRGNVYVTTPWSVCRIGPDGTVTTLAGYRHPSINSYWEDPSNVEVVGDFGPDEPMFHEIWGATWVKSTLAVNTAAAPIPSEDNRQPHIVGPRLLVTNPQNDRVQACDFPARSHGPAKVTTWFEGKDCWDVVGPWNGSYFVSERGAHRIVQLDEQGNVQRYLLEGLPLSRVDHSRLVVRLAPLETIRAQDGVTGPEGLAIMDDWLYVASHAQGQIIKLNLVTGERVVFKNHVSDHNYFVKIAVSDGSFGPRHTVFVTTWTVGSFGFPSAYLPDGTKWSLASYDSSYVVPRGAGGIWGGFSYNGACGVGGGRMVGGGAGEGVWELSLATAPKLSPSMYRTGKQQWHERGYWLTHGHGGFGHYGLPLPWGETPEIDYYLQCFGHKAP